MDHQTEQFGNQSSIEPTRTELTLFDAARTPIIIQTGNELITSSFAVITKNELNPYEAFLSLKAAYESSLKAICGAMKRDTLEEKTVLQVIQTELILSAHNETNN